MPRSQSRGDGRFTKAFSCPPQFRDQIYRNAFSHSFPYSVSSLTDGGLKSEICTVVTLETSRFKVSLLPEAGGKIQGIYDKHFAQELIWRAPISYHANVGLSGRWGIGGIEWNCARLGHLVHAQSNLGYSKVLLQGGQEGVVFGATDELQESSWQVTLILAERQVLARIRYQNHSSKPQPQYWWTNIAVPIAEQTRFLYQPGPVLAHTMAYPNSFFEEDWPIYRGKDASDWHNQVENISAYLYQNSSPFMGYSNTEEGFSFFHRADPAICKGRKLWSLSSSHPHSVWWNRLAEPAWMPYAEMQSGLSRMQVELGEMAPGQIIEWTEAFGSIGGGFECTTPSKYQEFEAAASQSSDEEWAAANRPDYWAISSQSEVLPCELRLKASEDIVRHERVNLEVLDQIITTGWVGGQRWVEYLEEISSDVAADSRRQLAYGAALADDGREEEAFVQIDSAISRNDGQLRGLASCLKGNILAAQGKVEEAVASYRDAIQHSPERILAYRELTALLRQIGREEDVESIWIGADSCLHGHDEYRLIRAEFCFAKGDFPGARSWLEAPLYQTVEADMLPWLFFKESYIAEAFGAASNGDWEMAMRQMTLSSKEYPQFTIGRDEVWLNVDPLYYRWAFANHIQDDAAAASFMQHAFGRRHRPHSLEAVYQFRLAKAVQHPSAAKRQREICDFERTQPPGVMRALNPLRDVVLESTISGSKDPWSALATDRVYRYRALWEMEEAR